MTKRERVIGGLERLARECEQELKIQVEKNYSDAWMIVFTAGNVSVQMNFDTWCRSPDSVIDAFGEELIKMYA